MNRLLPPGQRRHVLVLGLTALAILAGSCGKRDALPPGGPNAEDIGQVGLAITVASDLGIATVRYKISRAGVTPIEGSFRFSDPKQRVSGLVDLPVGTGYLAQFFASSADGKTDCTGDSAPFVVLPRQTTSVAATLQCHGPNDSGTGRVDLAFNQCPRITSVVVAPLAAPLGRTINVSATALDPEASAPVTFRWSASSGAFASAGLASTSYVCMELGSQTLTLSVTDGQCTETRSIEVTCEPALCGNGLLDAGEECDAPQSTYCTSLCRFPQGDAVCRSCVQESVRRGECASSGCDALTGDDRQLCVSLLRCMRTTQCSVTAPMDCLCGTARGSACALTPNGACLAEVQAATKSAVPAANILDLYSLRVPAGHATQLVACEQEECKGACSAKGCGNGVIEPPEQCDSPQSAECRPDCTRRKSDACKACEQANSSEESCMFGGCDTLTGTDKDLCESLSICLQDTQCGAKDPITCLCGSLPINHCAIGAEGDGVCKAQILAAARTTNSFEAGVRFYDPSLPVGRATRMAVCDLEFCANACEAVSSFCGDGRLDPGEQCDPPGTRCDSRCRAILPPAFCGDGRLDPGEQCDPPNSSTCSSSCRITGAPI